MSEQRKRTGVGPLTLGAVALVGAVAVVAIVIARPQAPAHVPVRPTHEGPSPPGVGAARYLLIGGGSVPELNQVSIEQDLALAREVLGNDPYVLFAGGPGSASVQVLDPEPRGDPLLRDLGQLFDPRGARDAHYRATTLGAVRGAASATDALAAIRHALANGRGPLFVYLTTHGSQGETPRENALAMWGDSELDAVDLATALDGAPEGRRTRIVIDSCYAGGFADIAFARADEAAGAPVRDRCGFFASTWDREATGCDPEPDRHAHEGYGLHFFHALRREGRDGAPLAPSDIDFDGDGRVSLFEAHTRVRIASMSIDVPTTTSERWLRHAAPPEGPSEPVRLPEEDALIAAIAGALGIADRLGDARSLLDQARADLTAAEDRAADAEDVEGDFARRTSALLLARWPMLDDPWHPDFAETFARDHDAIRAALDASDEFRMYKRAGEEAERRTTELEATELRAAPLERLVRALDTKEMAGRLRAAGGPDWSRYERLLACERSAP